MLVQIKTSNGNNLVITVSNNKDIELLNEPYNSKMFEVTCTTI